jgi:hypothetical protein
VLAFKEVAVNTTQIAVGVVLSLVVVALVVSFVVAAGSCGLAVAMWMSHRAVLNPRASRHLLGLEPQGLTLATEEA